MTSTTAKDVDPVTFEILSHRLHEITREMGATLERVGGTDREPGLVLEGVKNGAISRQTVNDIYGVVMDEKTYEIDTAATEELRARMRLQRLKPGPYPLLPTPDIVETAPPEAKT